jgi:isocitrate lyase
MSSRTYGALDPIQAINMGKYLTSIYVSGWQCSSTHVPTHDYGPDFADYPYNTVPDKVKQLVSAQMFHDRKQNEERERMTVEERINTPKIDYLTPIIADADAGFGGITSTMKLVKLFIDAGAAGIHIEDQRAGVKKCGHMGGKVLVSTEEHCTRLQAARLQSDVMGAELILVARTDSLSATLLDNNIDPRDHCVILGQTDPQNAESLGTFPEAGRTEILLKFKGQEQTTKLDIWNKKAFNLSLSEAKLLAHKLGFEFYFDWEAARTSEGYYTIKGCAEYSVKRGRAFADYADLLWCETPTPDLVFAKKFSDGIHLTHPNQMLAYNLSPSFNWDVAKMNDNDIEMFIDNLAKLGFCW